MTACLAHIAPLHHPGHWRMQETASTPTRRPANAAGSKSLLCVLTVEEPQ